MSVRACTGTCTCTYRSMDFVCMNGDWKRVSGVLYQGPSIPLRQGLFPSLGFKFSSLGWKPGRTRDSSVSADLRDGLTGVCCLLRLLHGQ